MNFSQLTLIVVTCKKYEDVLNILIENEYFKELINSEFSDIILASDNDSQVYDNKIFSKFCFSKNWGDRIVKASNLASTEYSLIILDDYVPIDYVHKEKLLSQLSELSNFDCIYLSNILSVDRNGFPQEMLNNYFRVKTDSLFSINTGPAIWSNEILKQIFYNVDDPWAWEAFSSFQPKNKNLRIFSPSSKQSELYHYTPETGGVVYRGSFVVSSLLKTGLTQHKICCLDTKPKIIELSDKNRSFMWKFEFMLKGLKMLGPNLISFVYSSLKSKYIK